MNHNPIAIRPETVLSSVTLPDRLDRPALAALFDLPLYARPIANRRIKPGMYLHHEGYWKVIKPTVNQSPNVLALERCDRDRRPGLIWITVPRSAVCDDNDWYEVLEGDTFWLWLERTESLRTEGEPGESVSWLDCAAFWLSVVASGVLMGTGVWGVIKLIGEWVA